MTDSMGGEMERRIARLAEAYTPEWRFTRERPDAGSVAALLVARMLEDGAGRLSLALHKRRIEFLNLFDQLVPEPLETAKGYVRFTPVPGVEEPVYVPRGTRLSAVPGDIRFETTHGVTASGARIAALYAVDRARDAIVRLDPADFEPFCARGENENEHLLLLWFEDVFEGLDRLDAALLVTPAPERDAAETAAALCGEGMRFFAACAGGGEPVGAVCGDGGVVRLKKRDFCPARGENGFLLGLRAQTACDLPVASVRLLLEEEDLLPDIVTCQGVAQNIGHFLPFGGPMELYAECGIENARVLSKKGARVVMRFEASYKTLRQRLPEYEESTDYRIVMKRPQPQPRMAEEEVRADCVLLEYWSVRGWRRLSLAEDETHLWNGAAAGSVELCFTCPADLVPLEAAAGQPRLRLRLTKAGNLYRVPCVQYCPVMEGLRFSYSYGDEGRLPDRVLTRNAFETLDITERMRRGQATQLFYRCGPDRPALYVGFDAPPVGSPLSLYWELENDGGRATAFAAEYDSPGGFAPVKAADGTGGLLYSGAMLLVVPADVARRERFGRELYWLRFVRLDGAACGEARVRGLLLNLARVENTDTRTEEFYLDEPDAPLHIRLSGRGLIRAAVFVREGGEGEERWAERPAGGPGGPRVDLAAGEIDFPPGALAPRRDGPAVRVEYQEYQGAAANVEAGQINIMTDSVRFISAAENPFPAYGGHDCGAEEAAASRIAGALRTRRRAVSAGDYLDLLRQVSCGVRRVRCCRGVGRGGEPDADAVTVAVLLDEYEKGSHIFSALKEELCRKLLESSSLPVLGRRLILTQPRFVAVSVRLWVRCGEGKAEGLYDLQQNVAASIGAFLDPLAGGFDGRGWEIGELPTAEALLAALQIRHPDLSVARIAATVRAGGREFALDGGEWTPGPFAMAVNGEHRVIVETEGGI